MLTAYQKPKAGGGGGAPVGSSVTPASLSSAGPGGLARGGGCEAYASTACPRGASPSCAAAAAAAPSSGSVSASSSVRACDHNPPSVPGSTAAAQGSYRAERDMKSEECQFRRIALCVSLEINASAATVP